MGGLDRLVVLAALALALAAGACGFGSEPLEVVDPDAAPGQPDYATDIAPIMALRCNACHSADALVWSRATPYLDEQGSAEAWACQSWQTIVDGSMPPGALDRLSASEELTMERWAAQLGCRVR